MASGSRRFGVRFAPNRAWRAPYRVRSGRREITEERAGKRVGAREKLVCAERRAGEIERGERSAREKRTYQRAGEQGKNRKPHLARADAFSRAAGRSRCRRAARTSLPRGRGRCSGPLPVCRAASSGPPPSHLLCSAAALVLRLLWSAEPPPVMVLFVAVCLSTR